MNSGRAAWTQTRRGYNLVEMKLEAAEDRGGYLACTFTGEVSIDALYEALMDLRNRCRSGGYRGALVDLTRAAGTLTGLERFQLAMKAVPRWDRRVYLAVSIRPEQAEPGRFGQLFAQNRGFPVRVFSDHEAASNWIEQAVTREDDP